MTFVYMIGRSMLSPISPTYFQFVHLSEFDIGVLVAGFGLAFLVSEAAWGFASSRVWSRKTIFVLILISGLLSFPMSQPQPFAVLLAIQVASGLAFGGIGIVGRLFVPKFSEPKALAKSFGYLGLVFALGSMAGSLVGGVVYGAVGLSSSFIVAGLACMASILPAAFLQFGGAARVAGTIKSVESESPLPAPLLSYVELVAIGLVGLASSSASMFYNYLLPNILVRQPSYPATVLGISLVIALFNFSSGVFQPIMGQGGSRNPRRWITLALVGCGLTSTLLLFSTGILEVCLLSLLSGIASATVTPLALSVLNRGVPASRTNRVFGLYSASEDTGIIVAALAGGLIWADFGGTSVFLAMAAFFFATTMVFGLASYPSKGRLTLQELRDRR